MWTTICVRANPPLDGYPNLRKVIFQALAISLSLTFSLTLSKSPPDCFGTMNTSLHMNYQLKPYQYACIPVCCYTVIPVCRQSERDALSLATSRCNHSIVVSLPTTDLARTVVPPLGGTPRKATNQWDRARTCWDCSG